MKLIFKNKIETIKSNPIDVTLLFVSLFLLGFMLYLKPGMDNIIDLMNYHAYNGWAITSGEWWNHFHPGFVHNYYINIQDIFHWFLLDSLNIEWVVLILSIIHLSIAIPIYLITRELEPSTTRIRSAWIAILSLSTIFFLPHVGDFNGDIISALPMFYAIWLLIRATKTGNLKLALPLGILTGLSLAMKLTNAIYFPFFLLFLSYWLLKSKIKLFLKTIVYTISFFLIFIAPQSLAILSSTDWKNPLFPLYNNIFKSTLAPEEPLDLSIFKIPASQIIDLYTRNLITTSLSSDLRYVYFITASLILFASILIIIAISKKNTNQIQRLESSDNQLQTILVITILSVLASIAVWGLQFGFNRYYFGIWILMLPLSFISLSKIIKLWHIKNNNYENILSLFLVIIFFMNINPTASRPYQLPVGEKLFSPIVISEIAEYDAIILPGPGQATWLAVLHREHIAKSGQLWLSTAFNRADAERADELISEKARQNTGYIAILGNENHTNKNLATLGYTNAGNCSPINIDKYGYWYSIYSICEAVYTGVYKYEVANEEKIYGGGSASTPIPKGDIPPEIFINFRER